MLKVIIENKLVKRFSRKVKEDSLTGILPAKPGVLSKWIFPLFLGIIVFSIGTLWFIPHPEIVTTKAVITGMNTSGNAIYVELDVSGNNLQSIDSGQLVQMRFYDYNSSRFGVVEARLQHVSDTPINNALTALVSLPRGLITRQNKIIPYKAGAKADVLIITKDMRLLERIFYKSASAIAR